MLTLLQLKMLTTFLHVLVPLMVKKAGEANILGTTHDHLCEQHVMFD